MNILELAFSHNNFVLLWNNNQAIRNFVAKEPYELYKLVNLLKSIDDLCLQ